MNKNRIWLVIFLAIILIAFIFFFYDDGFDEIANDSTINTTFFENNVTNETIEESNKTDKGDTNISDINRYVRKTNTLDYSSVKFTPWDISEPSKGIEKQDKKPYTIMIYMNGSNLESEDGAASLDLDEMLNSHVDTKNVNIIILVGGTKKWQDFGIPSDECSILQIKDSKLYLLFTIGKKSMGDAGTLSSFINFSMENYPADKYGLIMWDHGGGSIYGFGYDENFKGDGLTLLEMNKAFESSYLKDNRLEFIGFDACLMASVEMSTVASDYANYLIGSEDLEPGYGFDYAFLTEFNGKAIRGDAIGKAIVDKTMDFYEYYDADVTLSVIDLTQIGYVLGAMDTMMNQCEKDLSSGSIKFSTFSRIRAGTKTFGSGSPRDNYYDMVDLGDMATKLKDLYPGASGYMEYALNRAVVYNRYTTKSDSIHGLTAFYIYGEKDRAQYVIDTYESLKMSENYTKFQKSFASSLTGNRIFNMNDRSKPVEQNSEGDYFITLSKEELDNLANIDFTVWEKIPDKEDYYLMIGMQNDVTIDENGTCLSKFSGIWPGASGQYACLYEVSKGSDEKTYAIPAQLNGKNVDIIAIYSDKYPKGKILGARSILDSDSDYKMAQKGLTAIKGGDEVAFCYFSQYLGADESKDSHQWYVGESFKVEEELTLENYKASAGDVYLYGFKLMDTQKNESYSDFVKVSY